MNEKKIHLIVLEIQPKEFDAFGLKRWKKATTTKNTTRKVNEAHNEANVSTIGVRYTAIPRTILPTNNKRLTTNNDDNELAEPNHIYTERVSERTRDWENESKIHEKPWVIVEANTRTAYSYTGTHKENEKESARQLFVSMPIPIHICFLVSLSLSVSVPIYRNVSCL